ncbi:MAG: ABC transporter ATP-binding protein [Chloroflexota bacterium]
MQLTSTIDLPREVEAQVSTPAIYTQGLAKQYHHTSALRSLTMDVPQGEIFGFLGPNGAGKTTAVKLLVGLIKPTGGEGRVLGEPLGDRETRRRIGYLPELFRYQDWLSGREVLSLHCKLAGIPPRRRDAEIAAALNTVSLEGREHDRVGTYSKGMQQRLGLAVALLGEPDLVFLDEPTSALDPVGRHDVREIIRALKQRRTTVFLNSHLLTEVEQVCDRVAVVNKGEVIALGTLSELRGVESVVRIRLSPGADTPAVLLRYGAEHRDGRHVVRDISPENVAGLVTELVRSGAAIYAVEPETHSLEDRFLELLGGTNAGSDDRDPHAA